MFKKKDYTDYFKQLYDVEIIMKKEVESILKLIEDPTARELLERIRKDEMRHARIVKSMLKLI